MFRRFAPTMAARILCKGHCQKYVPTWVTPETCKHCAASRICKCGETIYGGGTNCNRCVKRIARAAFVTKNGEFVEGWNVKVSLSGTTSSHCGYCSDSGEVSTNDTTITMYFPATTKMVENEDVMLDAVSKLNFTRLNSCNCNCAKGETRYDPASLTCKLKENTPHMRLSKWSDYCL